MKRELSIAFCGAGAAMLAFGRKPEVDLLSCAAWLLAFAGVRELTDKRTPKIVYAAPIAAYLLDALAHIFSKGFESNRLTIGAPVLGGALMAMALFITIVAAAPKIGPGLAGGAGIGLVLLEGERAYARQIALIPSPDKKLVASATHLLDAIGAIGSAGRALVVVVWIALCAAPFAIEIVRSRRLLIAGAIGFGTCWGLFSELASREARSDLAVAPSLLYLAGWILCILGTAAIARSTKRGRAWAGFVMCIVQVPAFIAIAVEVEASDIRVPIAMSMAFGALGLALAMSTHRLLRWPSILFAVATAGSLLLNMGVFLALSDIVHIHADPTEWWVTRMARETFTLGLLVAFVMSLLLTAPPKAIGSGQTLSS